MKVIIIKDFYTKQLSYFLQAFTIIIQRFLRESRWGFDRHENSNVET